MRVSTHWQFTEGMDNILKHQVHRAKTSERISSGRDLTQASDDPVRAARARELERTLAAGEQYQRNTTHAEQRLALSEDIVNEAENVIYRVRELAIQAANDTYNEDDRWIISNELEEHLDELLALANTRDANGEYLFAGSKVQSKPFATDGTNYLYRGDDGQRYLQVNEHRRVAVSDSGREVFMNIARGNGTFEVAHDAATNTGSGVIDPGTVIDPGAYAASVQRFDIILIDDPIEPDGIVDSYEVYDRANPPPVAPLYSGTYEPAAQIQFAGIELSIDGTPAVGDRFQVDPSAKQDLFTTVQKLIDTLRTETGTAETHADQKNEIKRALTDLGQGLNHLIEVRGNIGGRLRATQDQLVIHESVNLRFKETLSDVAATNLTEAITALSEQQAALQAAQQTFVQMQRMSLFDLL